MGDSDWRDIQAQRYMRTEFLERVKDALSGLVEAMKEFTASVLYRFRKVSASDEQRSALPKTYSEYRNHKTTYGIAPGDSYDMGDRVVLITSVDGPPDMNAEVRYLDVENGIEYRTGLVNVLRQI